MFTVILDITGIVVEVDNDDAEHAMNVYGQDDLQGGAAVHAREHVYKVVNETRLQSVGGVEVREVNEYNDRRV